MTPKPEAELKALRCPFCGGDDVNLTDATRILGVWRIIHRCKVVGPISIEDGKREGVLTTWNTRATEPASVPGDVVEAVREIVDRVDQAQRRAYHQHERFIPNPTIDMEEIEALRALLAAVPVVEPQPDESK